MLMLGQVTGRRSLVEVHTKLLQKHTHLLKAIHRKFTEGVLSTRQLAQELNKAQTCLIVSVSQSQLG